LAEEARNFSGTGFDRYGRQIPVAEYQVVQDLDLIPRFMLAVEDELLSPNKKNEELDRLSEIVAAGKAFWQAALQGAIDLFSGDGGMLSDKESEPKDEGRRKAVKIENLRGEKPGWKISEGSNFWSVDEKDPYWKTQEGYEEALDLYGTKPSSLKEQDIATLVYNPSTGEYEEVEQEEFVDLSRKVDPKLKKYF